MLVENGSHDRPTEKEARDMHEQGAKRCRREGSRVDLGHRAAQVADQVGKRRFSRDGIAPDKDIVPAVAALGWKNHAGSFAQATFGAVACH